MDLETAPIAVIGLGYVGLPLAVEFGKIREVIGFDVDAGRIDALKRGHDATLETSAEDLKAARFLRLTTDVSAIAACKIFIVTVPTPVNAHKQPDLTPLLHASKTVGAVLKPGDLVIYESTVYPGATEEDCVPVLEQVSGLRLNQDFFAGYSPERINPGDQNRRLPDIVKVTSGSTAKAANAVDALYASIIKAGTHQAPSIRTAEAAKVIENTQRDLNIALINELAMIFSHMELDTEAVLEAAATKWNFLPFKPGLVGGHCIGVDPYYLTHKATALGYHPQIILAGRQINDGMGRFVAQELIKVMIKRKIQISGARVLIMGLAFKENCPDLRNSKVIDVITELQEFDIKTDVFEPCANPDHIHDQFGLTPVQAPQQGVYDAIILAVAHQQFRKMQPSQIRAWGRKTHVFYDLKSIFTKAESDLRL